MMKAFKSREVHSTEFGLSGNLIMGSYVRKTGMAVVLLSTMHHNKVMDENSREKIPEELVSSAQVTEIANSTIGVGNAMHLCVLLCEIVLLVNYFKKMFNMLKCEK
ncbi:hypothetical protein ABVT39_023844 [Epinephelus coioides]